MMYFCTCGERRVPRFAYSGLSSYIRGFEFQPGTRPLSRVDGTGRHRSLRTVTECMLAGFRVLGRGALTAFLEAEDGAPTAAALLGDVLLMVLLSVVPVDHRKAAAKTN